jgi:transcriptional regulator with XRE-family HTH domain
MVNVNRQEIFANRVRSLRLAANLSIEKASELGGLSPGFWGEVERNVKEPCLESLYGFAQGLGVNVPTLLSFDDHDDQRGKRAELFALLDLFDVDQLEFIYSVALLTFRYRSTNRA